MVWSETLSLSRKSVSEDLLPDQNFAKCELQKQTGVRDERMFIENEVKFFNHILQSDVGKQKNIIPI